VLIVSTIDHAPKCALEPSIRDSFVGFMRTRQLDGDSRVLIEVPPQLALQGPAR
jgi:hypothetical protein